ncbi:sodium:solute symporter family protein [Accumulibacter sp.]|uniref:sodium:solute symporter family protein n=1 Tax=Accumulibacter sp. TaxID=2053492 RepID=UPI0025FEAB04|nr:sodium:solute symporter family protein [Accumulibacter sp.]MCM8596960.1 sodium:solute symporter family protein [Accumulibacter sp.]MCM8624454.1 sodium:solute symporter family protein [Accumulibacter sp.]MDS4051109.1 sodium:solute symporter family protein [Accumulibacter sp.]
MLIWFVVIYLLLSIGIGLYAATRVHNTKDFAVAGRSLPLPVVTATVFATWFGAEAVFGVSATFVREGLRGVVADPFGASLCLVIAGIFYGTRLYRLNVLTLGDFFRMRFNHTVEVLTTVCIVASYLGWVSAQIKALGLVFHVVTDGAVPQTAGMILGAAIVLTYTTFGGMLSVAILDFVQMGVVMGGMLYIGYLVSAMTGGVAAVLDQAASAGRLDFFPGGTATEWLGFIGAWVTMMLGSIPQQDVFQRVTSAKSARVAIQASILGAGLYFCFTFIPMFIAYSATLIDPARFNGLIESDSQLVLPTLVLEHTPVVAQAIFFGAVLSAIMSCSSATLLAPSVAFSENIVRSHFPELGDHAFLRIMRLTLVGFTVLVLGFALNSEASIFKMVENAYKVTLAGAFVPLFFGAYWKRATTQGALTAILGGLASWLLIEVLVEEPPVPAQLIGLGVSLLGMIAGSCLPQRFGRPTPRVDSHATLHHHAAALTHHSEAPHRHPH